jgi:predicted dinucleotide-binding enzyme
MKIGVIGAGNVGGTLGRGWAAKGHEVMYGRRDPQSARDPNGGRASSVAEAAAFGEVIALATPWGATEAALRSAGDLSGKVLLDCTNPLKADFSGLDLGFTTSGGEKVAAWARGARVVKIFNTTGFQNMANPRYGSEAATMFYCGDDAEAKGVAAARFRSRV